MPGNERELRVTTVMDAEEIAASGDAVSTSIDQTGKKGNYSLQILVEGDGTCKIEQEISNDNVSYGEPEGAADLFTGLTKTSGPGSDGKVFKQVTIDFANRVRLKVTETGTTDSVTVTLKLAIQ